MRSKIIYSLLSVAVIPFFLAACGGGGGGGGSDNTPPSDSSTDTLASTTSANRAVTIDPVIPEATRSKIQQVISPFGAAAPGSAVAVPSALGGDTMVMAVDAEDNILLATLVGSEPTVLSVSSTADALARIAFGPLPSPITPAAFQQAIQATNAYLQLVAAIQIAVDTGEPASQSAVVQGRLSIVLEQAIPALSAAMGTATAASQKMAPTGQANQASTLLSSHTLEVKAPFPFRVIAQSRGPYSIFIRGGNVDLVNTMQISWGAFSSVSSGTEVALPGTSVARSLASAAAPIFEPAPITVPGNNGLGFFLTVAQTEKSKTDNLQAAVLDTAHTVISLSAAGEIVPESCLLSMASVMLSPEEARAFARESSADTFLEYFKAMAVSQEEMRGVVDQCFVDPIARQNAAANAGRLTRAIGKFLSGVAAIGAVNDLVNLSSHLPQMVFYWNKS